MASKNMFSLLGGSDSEGEDAAPVAETKKTNNKSTGAPKARANAGGNNRSNNKKSGGGGGGGGNVGTYVAPADTRRQAPRNNAPRGRGGRAPRREFDRRSGSGRGRGGMKKGGAGGHNWGKATEGGDDAAPAEGETEEQKEEAVVEEEEEDNTMDIEQYKASLAEKRAGAGFEDLKPRTVAKIKGAKIKSRKQPAQEDLMTLGGAKERRNRLRNTDERKAVEVSFYAPAIDRGDRDDRRGGRGGSRGGRGGRGGRGRGGAGGFRGRGGRGGGRGLNLQDNRAFPALG